MRVKITAWEHRGASSSFSGRGTLLDLTIPELAAGLLEEATLTVAKGAGRCFALGTSEKGGSNDDECGQITGMLLDLDDRAFFDRVPAIEEALKRNGLAYIVSTRAQKAHVLVFFEKPITPPHDKAGEKAHKAKRVRLLEALGADFEVAFDPAPGKRFLGLIYPYNKLPDAPETAIETRWSDGAGIDFDAFLEALGEAPAAPEPAQVGGGPADFFAAARAAAANGGAASPAIDVDDFEPLSKDNTLGALWSRCRSKSTSNPDVQRRVKLLLAGKVWATVKEQRDTLAQQVTSWIAFYTEGKGDIETIMEAAAPSLELMSDEQPTGFGDEIETKFHAKLVRNMAQTRALRAREAEQLNRIAAALNGRK